MKLNPFRPSAPVEPTRFVGRRLELEVIEDLLRHAKVDRPSSFLVHGERGVGKTSLLNLVRPIARGVLNLDADSQLNFIVISVEIDERTTMRGFIRKIEAAIESALLKEERARSLITKSVQFLGRVEAAGTRVREASTDQLDELLIDQFSDHLVELLRRICKDSESSSALSARSDGLVILVDEINMASREFRLGSLVKLVLERLQREDCERLIFGLAGLPESKAVLESGHPSSLRALQVMELGPLAARDAKDLLRVHMELARIENETTTVFTGEAMDLVVSATLGYPHFIQQIGYVAFQIDEDNEISRADVLRAMSPNEGGALLELGRSYFGAVDWQISRRAERDLIGLISGQPERWVTRKQLLASWPHSRSTLDHAMSALVESGLLQRHTDERGAYRLTSETFGAWVRCLDLLD